MIARITFGLMAFVMPIVLWAQDVIKEPETIDEAIGFLPTIIKLIQEGNWLLAGSAITMVLVFAFRKFVMPGLGLGSGVLPIVSAILGLVSGLGLAVFGGASPQAALLAALSGPLASLLWDAVFKYFFPKTE